MNYDEFKLIILNKLDNKNNNTLTAKEIKDLFPKLKDMILLRFLLDLRKEQQDIQINVFDELSEKELANIWKSSIKRRDGNFNIASISINRKLH